eukprot:9887405-Ditylum_brightwellii.AAC.1
MPEEYRAELLKHWKSIFGMGWKPLDGTDLYAWYFTNSKYFNALMQIAIVNGEAIPFYCLGTKCVLVHKPKTAKQRKNILNAHKKFATTPYKLWRGVRVKGIKIDLPHTTFDTILCDAKLVAVVYRFDSANAEGYLDMYTNNPYVATKTLPLLLHPTMLQQKAYEVLDIPTEAATKKSHMKPNSRITHSTL